MSLNTYPYSPFPASTEQLHKGDNEDLQAQIDAIKDGTNIDSFGDVETALGVVTGDITNLETNKTDTTVIAPTFDAEAGTYDVGNLVTYDGRMYEFISAHDTPGAWDPTEVTEKTVANELNSLESGLTNVANQLQNIYVRMNYRQAVGYNDITFTNRGNGGLGVLITTAGMFIFRDNGTTLTAKTEGLTISDEGNNVFRFTCGGDWYTHCILITTWDISSGS